MIDIGRIAAAALNQARTLLPGWLPEGRWDGVEWRCGDLSGAEGDSCAANSKTGMWCDFQTMESGRDLVSLYAAIHRLRQGEAAREVAEQIGYSIDDAQPAAGRSGVASATRPRVASATPADVVSATDAAVPSAPAPRTDWAPLLPVPDDAGDPPVAHLKRGRPERRWDYRDAEGRLLGCVYRFRTSDGGKEVLPCTYCEHPSGAREWRWVSFREPRPLYWPDPKGSLSTSRAVLIVEGEKCADAAHAELAAWFDVVSWPGGGKAVGKVAWAPLTGRRVVLWPDADAKLGKDRQLLAVSRQPGFSAMRRIADTLYGMACVVRMVDVPAPGEMPDGWDVADAIAGGLTGDALRAWIIARLVVVEGLADARAAAPASDGPPGNSTPPSAGAGGGGDDDDWRVHLIERERGKGFEDCRENVMLTLTHHPAWRDAIGYNAFAGRTESLARTPWSTGPGEWTTRDDRELGLWLAQRCRLLIRAEGNLSAGVEMAAERATYHPVIEYLERIRWDGTRRLAHWLIECCGVEDTEYTRRAGMYFLRSMVARVLTPGAQVDHMLVLEGGQGRGKSSVLRILAGDWFSDTQLKLGDKDALLGLTNVWLYEVSELDAFSKADVTAVKAFLTTLNDNVRGVYERRVRRRPRQVVMAGTTNQERYLRDMTGNRRFWPVTVGEVDLVRVADWRDQLFAEALHDVRAGERWWPTRDEAQELFVPAQDLRVIADPWLDELPARLAQPKFADQRTWTTSELLQAIGVTADKIDSAGQMARRIEQIMHALGWARTRERRQDGTRPHVYARPSASSTVPSEPIEVPL